MFYPHVMISAALARESDDLRQAMSPFSLFLSSFSGVQRILGYVRPRRIVAVHPPKSGKRRSTCGHLEEPLDWDSPNEPPDLQLGFANTRHLQLPLQQSSSRGRPLLVANVTLTLPSTGPVGLLLLSV